MAASQAVPHPAHAPALRDLRPMGRGAQAAAVAYFATLTLGLSAFLAWHYRLTGHALARPRTPLDEGSLLEGFALAMLGMLAVLAVQLVTAILALRWHHAAQANLGAAGLQGVRWSAGWAVGGWLIPYANLVIPFLVMRETWRGSHAQDPAGWVAAPVPAWIGWWWGLWVGGSMLPMAVHMAMVFTTLRSPLPWGVVFAVDLAAIALTYGAALALWLRLVREVSQAQAGLAHRSGRALA